MNVPSKMSDVGELRTFEDTLLSHVRNLEALKITGDEYGVFLTPIILSRLPAHIRLEWARDSEDKESDLNFLLGFLKKEIQRRERCVFPFGETNGGAREEKDFCKTKCCCFAVIYIRGREDNKCAVCRGWHKTERSHSFLMSISERRKTVQKAGLCFCCLDSSHQSFRCLVRCAACGGKHHRLCCPVDVGEVKVTGEHSSGNGSTETDSATNEGATGGGDILHVTCHVQEDREVVLPTARVLVHGVNTAVHCTVLFDSGSDRSYVSAELVEQSWVSVVWQ